MLDAKEKEEISISTLTYDGTNYADIIKKCPELWYSTDAGDHGPDCLWMAYNNPSAAEVDADNGTEIIAIPIGSILVFTSDGRHYIALTPVIFPGTSGQIYG